MEREDNELVSMAQEGNMAAFEELVYRYDRQILAIAVSYAGNTEDAKDIYQDVFIRVYRALPKFEFRSKFSTWLHRIATNVCLTHRYKQKKHRHASLDQEFESGDGNIRSLAETIADPGTTDQHTMNTEISEHVQDALSRLSPQQRLVFTLRHYEGYKLKEIAAMMKCAEGTVKKYLFTATERLRGELKEVFE